MGVIGTVMGLVQVLANMSNAEELAASIATAFVATLYGVAFANLIYMPIVNKLKGNLKRQKMQKEIIVDGICMMVKGEAARNIENKLALYYQAYPNGDKKYKQGIEN
jgi:chemotaxis protein MotA